MLRTAEYAPFVVFIAAPTMASFTEVVDISRISRVFVSMFKTYAVRILKVVICTISKQLCY